MYKIDISIYLIYEMSYQVPLIQEVATAFQAYMSSQ